MENIQIFGSDEKLNKVIAFCEKNGIAWGQINQRPEDLGFTKMDFGKPVKSFAIEKV